jgi:hypothetical protein
VSAVFSGLPQLEKLMNWQRMLPDIVATLVLSSADQTKVPLTELSFEHLDFDMYIENKELTN